jgi:hypothetical protein
MEVIMEIFNHNPKIYLIGGKAHHGKTTVGRIIIEEYEKKGQKAARLYLMKYVKDYIKEYFGWDGREETKPRELLQVLGTDIIRKKLGKEYFYVNRIIEDIEILSYFFDVIVIDDVRYKLEIEEIKKKFSNVTAIKIIRENNVDNLTEKQKQHPSEVDLDDYNKFDYVIMNDITINNLVEKTRTMIKKENENENNDK